MRKLTVFVLVIFGLYAGYWFVGSAAVERGLNTWLADRQDDAWLVEYSDLNTRGFPSRFDTTITDIELVDTQNGLAWSAPFFQLLALSYRPTHVIAVWPNEQLIATPYEEIVVTSTEMKASAVVEAGTSLPLDRSVLEVSDLALTSDLGWSATVRDGQLATRRIDTLENGHEVNITANGVRPPEALLSFLDPADLLPNQVKTLQVDVSLGFDAPWDRFALEQKRPQITVLELNDLKAKWGDLDLRAAGALTVNRRGVPTGEITLKARNWREMLEILIQTGVIPEGSELLATRALEVLAEMSDNPKTLDAPLTFRNGRISLGLIPLGPAPRLVIR